MLCEKNGVVSVHTVWPILTLALFSVFFAISASELTTAMFILRNTLSIRMLFIIY